MNTGYHIQTKVEYMEFSQSIFISDWAILPQLWVKNSANVCLEICHIFFF